MNLVCRVCGNAFFAPVGRINRANKNGSPLFCSRECSGLARRKNKTDHQKKKEKAEYDKGYRNKNKKLLKQKKAVYYQRTRNPILDAERRKKRMPIHVEYCRRPEYKKWKSDYDRRYRAKKYYGEFSESHIYLVEIENQINLLATRTEIYQENGTINKSQKRKRAL